MEKVYEEEFMKSKRFKERIIIVLVIGMLFLSGCVSNNLTNEMKTMLNETENVLEESGNFIEEELENHIEDLDEVEEKSEDKNVSSDMELEQLEDAVFTISDLEVNISKAETFTEKADLNLTYVEGKGYLLVEGTITNNGNEETTLAKEAYVVGIDDCGNQIGNASSWIDATGLTVKVQPGETIDFNELYLYSSEAQRITFEYDPDIAELESNFYFVDVSDVNSEADVLDSEIEDAMNSILLTTSNTIIDAINNHTYENIPIFATYTFIAPSLDMDSSNAIWFEAYNWEACNDNDEVCDFGTDFEGNQVNMTPIEFFDQYIAAYNFSEGEAVIKQERLAYFPERPDSQVTHYVKYQVGENVVYLIYEETYHNEFALTGIAVGIE